jgi:hypothetical protein
MHQVNGPSSQFYKKEKSSIDSTEINQTGMNIISKGSSESKGLLEF